MKPEETIDFHIRWAWHRISRLYNAIAVEHGFSMAVGYVLLNVDRDGTPSTALGPKMGMESRSLTRTLKNMEETGLIYRKSDEEDKRKVLIMLTEEGKTLRRKAKNTVIEFNEKIREELGDKAANKLIDQMNELNTVLDNLNFIDEE